jgi:hypothetical protein
MATAAKPTGALGKRRPYHIIQLPIARFNIKLSILTD